MLTRTQQHVWNACENIGEQATEDKFTIDIEIDINYGDTSNLVELTREDLESMLSALDRLENPE